ncbi:Mov34/MPN/PAD-1 family protein [Prunus dulcis]|uniref:Mov34/MPN/PAD-1 family protein n=1 Tax=Prunus dulcis TaxID=3755 RepID=A0A4Y1RF67_PRUDU|nr:Mov34/MPN/PAD-1 family protein [Prunus dulcis]
MGLLLGSFPDEYTTHVVDVVAMPQRGTGVSVEAIDHVFQTDVLDMLKQTQRLKLTCCGCGGDPIQSVKGKVVIDAFRLINPNTVMLGQEPHPILAILTNHPALIHGLNRNYYSLAVNFRMNGLEEKMLLSLHKKKWTDGLTMRQFDAHSKTNEQTLQMSNLAIKYNNALQEDGDAQPEKLAIANVGRADDKKHLEEHVYNMMSSNIAQTLGTVLDTVAF